jgi:hypothetical protein
VPASFQISERAHETDIGGGKPPAVVKARASTDGGPVRETALPDWS